MQRTFRRRECMNINRHGITTINGRINHDAHRRHASASGTRGVKNIRRGKQSDKHRDDSRLEITTVHRHSLSL
jgi:hypothetical protein